MNPNQPTDSVTNINSLPLQFRAQLFRQNAKNSLLQGQVDPLSTSGRQYMQQVEDMINQQFQVENIQSGNVPLTSAFATQNPQVANQLIQAGIKVSEKPTASQLERRQTLDQLSPIIDRISKAALNAPTGFPGSFLAKLGYIPGIEGGEAEFLERNRVGFARQIAKVLAGESGVATDEDVQRWLELLPKPGDTFKERVRTLGDMVTQVEIETKTLGQELSPELEQLKQTLVSNGYQFTGASAQSDSKQKGTTKKVGRFTIEQIE